MGFSWQLPRVPPAAVLESDLAMTESGLHEEVEGLGSTLFSEIAKDAAEVWKKVFEGKTEVTHKALAPLKTMLFPLHHVSTAWVYGKKDVFMSAIMKAMPLVASMLGDKPSMKVVIGSSDTACTNGDTIFLPPLSVDLEQRM